MVVLSDQARQPPLYLPMTACHLNSPINFLSEWLSGCTRLGSQEPPTTACRATQTKFSFTVFSSPLLVVCFFSIPLFLRPSLSEWSAGSHQTRQPLCRRLHVIPLRPVSHFQSTCSCREHGKAVNAFSIRSSSRQPETTAAAVSHSCSGQPQPRRPVMRRIARLYITLPS